MANPTPHVPTDVTRRMVYQYTRANVKQEIMCDILDIGIATLHKYYKTELSVATSDLVNKAVNTIAAALDDPDAKVRLSAAVFIAKCRGRWSTVADDRGVDDSTKLDEIHKATQELKKKHKRDY
jgi:hypothetical protein